jgi:biotin-(acetyl-CoA carboxylase) ligase
LGIGVNIDFSAPGVREQLPVDIRNLATSMVECGSPETTEPLAIARCILGKLRPLYRRFEGGEPLSLLVREDPTHPGRRVRVRVGPDRSWTGLVDGLGPCGELLVRVATRRDGDGDPPPGGDWYLGRPGVVAVTAGDVTYE